MSGWGGSRPRMRMCYLCGREYGSKSLPIHIPQCQQKWLLEEEKKPKNQRRPLPQAPAEMDAAIKNGKKLTDAELDAINESAYQQWEQGSLERCPHCERTFKPEALARHSKMCTAERPFRKAGTGLTAASLSANLQPGAISGTLRETVDLGSLPTRTAKVNGKAPWHKRSPDGTDRRASMNGSLHGAMASRPTTPSTPPRGYSTTGANATVANDTRPRQLGSSARTEAASSLSRDSSVLPKLASASESSNVGSVPRFCDECGAQYLRSTSKFCSECGSQRVPEKGVVTMG